MMLNFLQIGSSLIFLRMKYLMQFEILQAEARDMVSFHALPKTAHEDPFDRMIIWQAICRGRTLVSKDGQFASHQDHGLKVLW